MSAAAGSSLIPRDRVRDDLVPGVVKVGAYDVRIRRFWGVGAPRWLYDLLAPDETGLPATITTWCSYPSPDDCARAMARHIAGRSVARVVDEATVRATAALARASRSPLGAPTTVTPAKPPKLRGVAAARARVRKARAS